MLELKPSRKKMDPEWKDKWITALRSGDYQQTRGTLRNYEGFCCLGVLCDLVEPNKWNIEPDYQTYGAGKAEHMPPCTVYEVVGLPRSAGAKTIALESLTNTEGTLASLNDRGYSFKEIADIIEKVY